MDCPFLHLIPKCCLRSTFPARAPELETDCRQPSKGQINCGYWCNRSYEYHGNRASDGCSSGPGSASARGKSRRYDLAAHYG